MSQTFTSGVDTRVAMARILGVAGDAIEETASFSRRHSAGWVVCVRDGTARRRYFVKQLAPSMAARQSMLMQRADGLFDGDPSYRPLRARHVDEADVVVTEDVSLPSLHWLLANGVAHHPLSWRGRAEDGIGLAGRWLRRLHEAVSLVGSPRPALDLYLDRREAFLATLPTALADALRRAVAACPDGPMTMTHCDFTPENILTDGERLSVLDFGIMEWLEMSPAWDLATFLVSLQVHADDCWRSPLHWRPGMVGRLQRRFLDAYGLPAPPETGIYRLCAALRHLQYRTRWLGSRPALAARHLHVAETLLGAAHGDSGGRHG